VVLSKMKLQDVFVQIQCLVLLPAEVFAEQDNSTLSICGEKDPEPRLYECISRVMSMFCCYSPAVFTSRCLAHKKQPHQYPTFRLGVSMWEWAVVIFFCAFDGDDEDYIRQEFGCVIFFVGFAMYIVATQYLYLLPDFSLPHGVAIRSIHGYAFNGEFEELKRIQELPMDTKMRAVCTKIEEKELMIKSFHTLPRSPNDLFVAESIPNVHELDIHDVKSIKQLEDGIYDLKQRSNTLRWDQGVLGENKILKIENEVQEKYRSTYRKIDDAIKMAEEKIWAQREKDIAQIPHGAVEQLMELQVERKYIEADEEKEIARLIAEEEVTPAMFALSNGHHNIVRWLEEQGATRHKKMLSEKTDLDVTDEDFFRRHIDRDHKYW